MSDQTWLDVAACSGMDMTPFFPERGGSVLPAARICATCPVVRECLADDLRQTRIHYASACGARGGIGGLGRRRLLVAMRDLDHPPERECSDDGCDWCDQLRRHARNLEVIAGLRPNADHERIEGNGPGATHGRKSTHARGCRCGTCKWARSTLGARISERVDAVAWVEYLVAPVDGFEGEARETTADFADLEADLADAWLVLLKRAASAVLEAA